MAYTKQTWNDLPNTTSPINATRLNHMEDGIETANTMATTLVDGLMSSGDKTKLDRIGMTTLFNGSITTKTTTTLSGNNVQWYDLVLVLGTTNAYDHRRITNVYVGGTLNSNSRYHTIIYSPTYSDDGMKLYDHTLDTTNCTNIGTNGCRIVNVYGIKIN